MVNLTIDGIAVCVPEGTTILDAAKSIGKKIPTLCFLKDINEIGACRMCIVEIDGYDRLPAACITKVREGMVVRTGTPRVREARRINMQLILSQHNCSCNFCTRSGNCALQTMARDLNLWGNPYPRHVPPRQVREGSYIYRDDGRCIKCMRCIQVCDKIQGMHIWDVVGTGSRTTVGVRLNREFSETECALCGQCITHCPTGGLREWDDTERVFKAIANPDIVTVVQVAPAVRAAWAEEFGLSCEEGSAGRLVTALKRLGFDYVFDTNFAADLTIMEEGSEFIERFTHKDQYRWPMFTSCCPGWVRFVKGRYPAWTDNLSTAKSPQQMFGSVAKSYFAEKTGIDPHKLYVVSVMPCVSKKSECDQPNQRDACGDPDVDRVLTTRELVRMLRGDYIDPRSLEETPFDSPLGASTGAAVIFGATGGVMDAALRSAYYLVTGSNPDPDAFSSVRGMEGWKEADFKIPGAGTVHTAVVSGLGNTNRLMEAIRKGQVSYDFVEVMACPGGCAGGGGQPVHDGEEYAERRGSELWRLDRTSALRFSHENPEVLALYRDYLGAPLGERSHHLLHTDHHGWSMPLSPLAKED